MKKMTFLFVFLALLFIFPNTQIFAAGKSAAEFYKGKTVEYVIPFGVGGGTDRLSRMMIPYLEKRLGCKLVPANRAGAGGLIGLNYIWNAKKNGLVMGTIMYDAAVFGEFVGSNAVRFEVDKLTLIGGLEKQALILCANKNGPYKKFEDIITAKQPVRMALPGKMSTMHVMMALAQDVWDFKLNFIPGYKGAAGQFKATEGGETDVNCGSEVSSAPRIKGETVRPLVYLTAERQDFFPDIPAILETPVKNEAAKERFISAIWIYRFARSLGMPPGVPQDRVEFVRAALKDTLKDPALIAEGKKNGVPFIYTPPEEYKKQKEKLFGGMSAEEKAHLKELLK